MRTDVIIASAIVAAVGIAVPFSAFPQVMQTRGFYAGGSIGQSRVDIDDNAVTVVGATQSSVSKEETDTAFKLFGGYRFGPHFALEGGYIDFGKFSIRRNVTAPAVGSLGAEVKAKGWNIDAVGILPFQNQFSLFGKLGALYSETKTSLSTTGAVVLLGNSSAKKTEWNLKWGLGASYDFSRTVAVRAEYEQAQKVGDENSTGEGDVGLLSIGLVVKF